MTNKLFVLAIMFAALSTSEILIPVEAFAFEPLFGTMSDYGVGDSPSSVFCADLDGDGELDLVVANYGSDNVSILKNNGDGMFGSRVNYSVWFNPVSVFCADLDGDGDLDLAVANSVGYISILKNNGNGIFQNKVDYEAGDGPSSVFCADLDRDNYLDLAVANFSSGTVSVLKNNGDGTFQTKVDYSIGSSPLSVFCADLDGDGDLDLVVANFNGYVSIMKNNGDGTFQSAVDYGAGNELVSVFCADVDGDSDLDLAAADMGSNNITIFKNNGNGTFAPGIDYPAGLGPRSVFCADVDGDSDLDLAVAASTSDSVSILENSGDGTFSSRVSYPVGNHPVSVFCADLDGDLDLDLAVANNESDSVSVLMNLSQIPPGANHPPGPFSLVSPDGYVYSPVTFRWQAAYDPDLLDQIRYNLYVSTSWIFNPDSTVIYDSLTNTHYKLDLNLNTDYFWKVKAYDRMGAERWSDQTWWLYVWRIMLKTVYVDDNNTSGPWDGTLQHPYQHIQDGIDNANSGDTVSVLNGTYYENVNVNKKVRLIGENNSNTIIDGGGNGSVINVCADSTVVVDFIIQHGNSCGILDTISNYCNFTGNIIAYNHCGILLRHPYTYVHHNTIYGNIIRNNNDFGIYLEHAGSNIISNNIIMNNSMEGIDLFAEGASGNIISHNKITGSYFGIFMDCSMSNSIYRNEIADNQEDGIRVFGASYNSIYENLIRNNSGTGIKVDYYPTNNNAIYHNNLVNNQQNAYDQCTSTWDNGYPSGGNYWSNFDETSEGTFDNNRDGIADSAYLIPGGNNKDRYPLMKLWNTGLNNCGDANSDSVIDVGDVVFLINYLFKSGPAPTVGCIADANADGTIDIGDVVFLINYLFKNGAHYPWCCS